MAGLKVPGPDREEMTRRSGSQRLAMRSARIDLESGMAFPSIHPRPHAASLARIVDDIRSADIISTEFPIILRFYSYVCAL
jgi:hypothetical protein